MAGLAVAEGSARGVVKGAGPSDQQARLEAARQDVRSAYLGTMSSPQPLFDDMRLPFARNDTLDTILGRIFAAISEFEKESQIRILEAAKSAPPLQGLWNDGHLTAPRVLEHLLTSASRIFPLKSDGAIVAKITRAVVTLAEEERKRNTSTYNARPDLMFKEFVDAALSMLEHGGTHVAAWIGEADLRLRILDVRDRIKDAEERAARVEEAFEHHFSEELEDLLARQRRVEHKPPTLSYPDGSSPALA